MAGTMTSNPQGPKPRISIIVAMAKNRVIGANNKLPWHLSADLKRFKALTMGHHIIMGRKTFESIGRTLLGRTILVISRNAEYQAAGAKVVHSISAALSASAGDSEVFIVGGEQIYRETLPIASRIYLTEIDKEFDGDSFFPSLASNAWRAFGRETHEDSAAGLSYSFVTYDRIE
jgi:dihydrofolate reductase